MITNRTYGMDADVISYNARIVAGGNQSLSMQSLRQLNQFVISIKKMNLWNKMICWPMKSSQNAGTGTVVYSLGGLPVYNGAFSNSPEWTPYGVDTLDSTNNRGVQIDNLPTVLIANRFSIMVVSKGLNPNVGNGAFHHNSFAWSNTGGGQNGPNYRPKDFVLGANFAVQKSATVAAVTINDNIDYGNFHTAFLTSDGSTGFGIIDGFYSATSTSLVAGALTATNPLYFGRRGAASGNPRCLVSFGAVFFDIDLRNNINSINNLYKATLGDGLGLV